MTREEAHTIILADILGLTKRSANEAAQKLYTEARELVGVAAQQEIEAEKRRTGVQTSANFGGGIF